MRLRGLRWRALVVGLSVAPVAGLEAALPLRPVVLSGQSAGPGGLTFSAAFEPPHLNDSGWVVFRNTVTGPGLTSANDQGLWLLRPGVATPEVVYREGQAVPDGLGAGGATFGSPTYHPVLNNAGQVSFQSLVNSPVSAERGRGMFLYTPGGAPGAPGTVATMARSGLPAAGVPGQSYGDFTLVYGLNDHGQAGFVGSGRVEGVWTYTPSGGTRLVAVEGQAVPDSPGISFLTNFWWGEVNPAGQVMFTVQVTDNGTRSLGKGVFIGEPDGRIRTIARPGQLAPGNIVGTTFGFDSVCPAVNAAGDVAFHAELANGDATSSSDDALYYRRAGGALTLVARQGRAAAVRAGDAPRNYTGENFWVALNRHGTFAYTDNDTGMWLGTPTASGGVSVRALALVGDQAAELAPGVRISYMGSPVINDNGQVTSYVMLSGPGLNSGNDQALYLWDPVKGWQVVAREGQTIQVGPGDVRTVAEGGLMWGGHDSSENGLPRSLGDENLVVGLRFTNGTGGVFAVPEPGSVGVVALGAAFVLGHRRRR